MTACCCLGAAGSGRVRPGVLFERAVTAFGRTTNPYKAGYILPDGTMLDFSAGGDNERGEDHRAVSQLFSDQVPGIDATDAMLAFMRAGAIRMMFSRGPWLFLDVAVLPTEAQWAVIAELVRLVGSDGSGVLEIAAPNGYAAQAIKEWNGRVPMVDLRMFVDGELSPAASHEAKRIGRRRHRG